MTKVIEFYVPEKFRKQNGKWIPPEQRGKIIAFPAPERSQHDMKAWAQQHTPADPLLYQVVREQQGTEEFEHNFL